MITNNTQLSASLRYISRFADALEGMRRHALEDEHSAAMLPGLSEGPLAQIRQTLTEIRAYVDSQPDSGPIGNGDGANTDSMSRVEVSAVEAAAR